MQTLAEETHFGEIVKLRINEKHASFLDGIPFPFCRAINKGRVNQSHFADPGASFRYRCSLCLGAIKKENLTHSAAVHGSALTEYRILLKDRVSSEFVVAPRLTGKNSGGAVLTSAAQVNPLCKELPVPGPDKNKETDHGATRGRHIRKGKRYARQVCNETGHKLFAAEPVEKLRTKKKAPYK